MNTQLRTELAETEQALQEMTDLKNKIEKELSEKINKLQARVDALLTENEEDRKFLAKKHLAETGLLRSELGVAEQLALQNVSENSNLKQDICDLKEILTIPR